MKNPSLLDQPNLVKPLHGMNPRTILGKKWWDVTRIKAYLHNNYCCEACGVHKLEAKLKKHLEAHEIYKVDLDECSYELVDVVALCHYCHSFIHSGLLSVRLQKGEISPQTYYAILEHGEALLDSVGIDRTLSWYTQPKNVKKLLAESNGTWDKWHLKLGDKKFYSKFKNYNDWLSFYTNI